MHSHAGAWERGIYHEEGRAVEVRLDSQRDTIWLSQAQMAELFDKDTDTIGFHLKNIYKDKELEEGATIEKSSVRSHAGAWERGNFYNLDAIISVGFLVPTLLRGNAYGAK